jgi:hypothetical protein
MPQLPASPTAYRKELAHRERMRLEQFDAKLDRHLASIGMGGAAQAAPLPLYTDTDVEEVGKLLVEGRLRLPKYARVTVTTEVEEIKDKIFGNSTVLTHLADQLCCHALQPMSIPAAIECKLLVKLGGNWLWSEATYRKLVPPDPRLIP